MTEALKGNPNTSRAMPIPAHLCVFVGMCACHLPKDCPSTTTKLGQSPRNNRKKNKRQKQEKRTYEESEMVKGEKVKTHRDRDRHKGKSQPVQKETKMDGKRHEKKKEMREMGNCGKKQSNIHNV